MTSFENLPLWCCLILVLAAWVPQASCCPMPMSPLVFHRIVANRPAVFNELFLEGMTPRRLPSLLQQLRQEARLSLTPLSLTGQLQQWAARIDSLF